MTVYVPEISYLEVACSLLPVFWVRVRVRVRNQALGFQRQSERILRCSKISFLNKEI